MMDNAPARRAGTLVCALVVGTLVAAGTASASAADVPAPPGANPQHRGYELVSLPDTYGAAMFAGIAIGGLVGRPPAVARAGGRAFVTSVLPVRDQPGAGLASSFTAVRTATGWQQRYNGLPARRATFDSSGSAIGWTPDFQTMLWSTLGSQTDPADPSAAVRGDGFFYGLLRQPAGGRPAEQLGSTEYTAAGDPGGEARAALSADGRTVTFTEPNVSLVAGTPLSSVYRRIDDGPPQLVSRLPDGTPAVSSDLTSVAPDGSSALFVDYSTGAERLVHRTGDAASVAIDRERGVPAGARTSSALGGASGDNRTIFFLTRDPLLPADTDTDADVYRWSADGDALTLISRGTGGGGNGTGADCPTPLPTEQVDYVPQGCDTAFVGTDRAGDVAWFVSPEALDGATGAVLGAANLYVRRSGESGVRYVTTFDPSDALPGFLTRGSSPFRESWVADDGALVMRSVRDPATGTVSAAAQVYRVDVTGSSVCVSCNRRGPDAGPATLGTSAEGAAALPDANGTADGRYVYFETPTRLVAEDRNAAVDVYEYDTQNGTQSLISAGTGADASLLAGVSADGADVMFTTRDSLVAEDRNGPTAKVYDARRDGGFPPPPPAPAPCRDGGCRASPSSAPPAVEPGSATFVGSGNVPAAAAATRGWTVGAISAAARARLVRTGQLTLSVKLTGGGGTVQARASAHIGSATTTVARASTRLVRSGTARLTLRLSAAARRALRATGSLRVSITVTVAGQSGAKTAAVTLRSSKSTTTSKGR